MLVPGPFKEEHCVRKGICNIVTKLNMWMIKNEIELREPELSKATDSKTCCLVWRHQRDSSKSERDEAERETMTMKMQLQEDMQSVDVTGEDAVIG